MKIWSPTKVHYYLKLQMLKVAKKERKKCNKKKEVTKFEDIGLSWQQDSSMENCEIMFVVMYGSFDLHIDWAKQLEGHVMEDMNLQYDEKTGTGKRGDIGCIEWLVHHSRREIVKLINARGVVNPWKKDHDHKGQGNHKQQQQIQKKSERSFLS